MEIYADLGRLTRFHSFHGRGKSASVKIQLTTMKQAPN